MGMEEGMIHWELLLPTSSSSYYSYYPLTPDPTGDPSAMLSILYVDSERTR